MNKTGIKIDRLEIRLRGISPQVARTLISGMEDELLRQFVSHRDILKEKRTIHIEKIELGTLKAQGDTRPSELQRTVASKIIGSVVAGYK